MGIRNSRWHVAAAALTLSCGAPSPAPPQDSSTGAAGSEASTGAVGTSSGSTSASQTSGETASSSSSSSSTGGAPTCNGSAALCERPYDQVVFAGTHNSVAATRSGFGTLNANQTHPVLTQLQDGIRVLLLDVTEEQGETVLCHGPCALGSVPHIEVLLELRDFMRSNPDAVVTIIYQDAVAPAEVEADFARAGLVELTYTHDGGAWPTLGEMVLADQRLVVTAENQGPPPAWYHHVWDLTFDTPYTFTAPEDFSCDLNRGQPGNPLFLINHWLSTEANLPDRSAAPLANSADVLTARIEDCRAQTGRLPTFVAVDFYEEGDLFDVVDALNAGR
ncbi:MAG: hypothetical protein ACE37F_13160 [Nannocystaceae bacterium]|nr:hypothetical protein [bacterium]